MSEQTLNKEAEAASARVSVPGDPLKLRWEWQAMEDLVYAIEGSDPAGSVPMLINECVDLAVTSHVPAAAERAWQEARWRELELPGELPPPMTEMFAD